MCGQVCFYIFWPLPMILTIRIWYNQVKPKFFQDSGEFELNEFEISEYKCMKYYW